MPPAYDQTTHLSTLLGIRKAWERDGSASTSDMAKINKAIKSRLLPNNQPAVDADTPLSKMLDLVTRFERHRDKRAFNFSESDAEYLKRVKAMAKRSRKLESGRERTMKKLGERRPALTDDIKMETLEQLRQELVKKKLMFPDKFGEDERAYLKRVKSKMGGIRRAETMAKQPKVRGKGLTKTQETFLSDMYYGNKKKDIPPTPMGGSQMYDRAKELMGSSKQPTVALPSKSTVVAWVTAQKLQQVYAPRRSEGHGDISAFKPIAPMVALSMDLGNYQRRQQSAEDKDAPKAKKGAPKFLDDFGADGYVLVVVDNFSRYMWTAALNSKKPSEVVGKLEEILDEVREESEGLRTKYDKDWKDNDPDKNVIRMIHFDDGGEFKAHVKTLLACGGTFGRFKEGKDTDDYLFTTTPKDSPMGDLDTLQKIGRFFGYDQETMDGHNRNIRGGKLKAGTEVVVPQSKYKPIKQLTTVGNAPQSNAIVERAIGTLKRIISKTYAIRGGAWRTILPEATKVYNEHSHRMIGMTPEEAIALPPSEQGELRTSVRESQIQDGTETKPPLKVGDTVRLRIGKPTFNSGSKQSYYSTVFKVKDVVKSKHPQKAIRYRLEGGKSSAANKKLLDKSYVQRYLQPVGEVEGGDKLVKDTLLKTG